MLFVAKNKDITGPVIDIAYMFVGAFCIAYWVSFAVRVIGYFGEYNENTWPKWVGLWATINIVWVEFCYVLVPETPLAFLIFIGPIVGPVMFVLGAIDSVVEGGLSATHDELALIIPSLMFWAMIAGLSRALKKGQIRQSAACALLVAGMSLVLAPHALGLL